MGEPARGSHIHVRWEVKRSHSSFHKGNRCEHMWPSGCNLSSSSWYLANISVRKPSTLQRNNKHIWCSMQTLMHPVLINNQRKYFHHLSHEHNLMFFFFWPLKTNTIKVCFEPKCVCVPVLNNSKFTSYKWFLLLKKSINLRFWVTVINSEHIPTVIHFLVFPSMLY